MLSSNSYNKTMYSYYKIVTLKSEYCLAKILLTSCNDIHTCTLKTNMYNPFETVVGFLHQGSLELSPFTMEKILDRHRTLGTRMASESRKVICCLIHVLHDIVFYITVLRKSVRVSVIQKSTVYTSSKLLHYKLIMTLFLL